MDASMLQILPKLAPAPDPASRDALLCTYGWLLPVIIRCIDQVCLK